MSTLPTSFLEALRFQRHLFATHGYIKHASHSAVTHPVKNQTNINQACVCVRISRLSHLSPLSRIFA